MAGSCFPVVGDGMVWGLDRGPEFLLNAYRTWATLLRSSMMSTHLPAFVVDCRLR